MGGWWGAGQRLQRRRAEFRKGVVDGGARHHYLHNNNGDGVGLLRRVCGLQLSVVSVRTHSDLERYFSHCSAVTSSSLNVSRILKYSSYFASAYWAGI